MDTALKAMKRAARAVLKDELRAMRKEIRQLREIRDVAFKELQRQVAVAQKAATDYSCENARLRDRSKKILQWAGEHRSGDFTIRACTEYILYGDKPSSNGTGLTCVNPFDRWGVSPAIR